MFLIFYPDGHTYSGGRPRFPRSPRPKFLAQADVIQSNHHGIWRSTSTLQSIHGRAPLKDVEITLKFSEGFAYGEAGCNSYFRGDETMKYKISVNGDLKIHFVHTGRLCPSPQGVMEQEKAYLQTLSSVTGYNLTEDRLELEDENGAIILVFTKL